jgi:hypothetical protein
MLPCLGFLLHKMLHSVLLNVEFLSDSIFDFPVSVIVLSFAVQVKLQFRAYCSLQGSCAIYWHLEGKACLP